MGSEILQPLNNFLGIPDVDSTIFVGYDNPLFSRHDVL